jgi:hypothetical protein
MPSTLQPVWAIQLVTGAVATTSAAGNSAVIRIPQAESYLFVLDCTTLTGTGTTLDVSLGISPQSVLGTAATTSSTWHYVAKFAEITTATGSTAIRLQPAIGRGEAANGWGVGGSATTNIATSSSATVYNVPLTPDIRFAYVPNCQTSYVFNIWGYGYAKADASY